MDTWVTSIFSIILAVTPHVICTIVLNESLKFYWKYISWGRTGAEFMKYQEGVGRGSHILALRRYVI